MAIEVPAAAAVVGADAIGRPVKITNMRDLEREAALPPPKVRIDAPAGYSHGPPDSAPYETGKHSLPPQGDEPE
jgi:hypothetical protein